ncbi:MAG: hypothetical protein Q9226_000370 [Calogaya cf. arnoldii]
MHYWLALTSLLSATATVSVASHVLPGKAQAPLAKAQTPLDNTDKCGLPTGDGAPQCTDDGSVNTPKIMSLRCNFTLFTTIGDVTLQYGATKLSVEEGSPSYLDVRVGASETFWGISDSTLNAYSPAIPPLTKTDSAVYKLWLWLVGFPRDRYLPITVAPDPAPRGTDRDTWGAQSLVYDCLRNNQGTFSPALTLSLPSMFSPGHYAFTTDVDAFAKGRDGARGLQLRYYEYGRFAAGIAFTSYFYDTPGFERWVWRIMMGSLTTVSNVESWARLEGDLLKRDVVYSRSALQSYVRLSHCL